MQCLLGQYTNEMYVIKGDNSPNIYIYNFANRSWNYKKTSGANILEMNVVLDHDTNVFYGLYRQQMYYLHLEDGNVDSKWILQGQSPFGIDYVPIIGFSQNHLFFLNDPKISPGSAHVFVIHFAYWQPEIQKFKGNAFPQTPGKTVIIPKSDNTVPLIFAFIPRDLTAIYLINAEINTNVTTTLSAPPIKDRDSYYSASFSSIYQLTSDYQIWGLEIEKSSNKWIQITNSVLNSLHKNHLIGKNFMIVASGTQSSGATITVKPQPSDKNRSILPSLSKGLIMMACLILI
jgi:hypothetical protein